MTTPTFQTFADIAPIIIQKYERYLPTAFDESMTLLEKVNKIIQTLNTVTDTTNDVISQWNSAMTWVTGDGLNQTVDDKLDAMVQDGTFDTIINKDVLNTKSEIVVSTDVPANPVSTTFWFENKGNTPVNFNGGSNDTSGDITVSSTAPTDGSSMWYQTI